jgi:uncharacterized alkaline shock family protein YloU
VASPTDPRQPADERSVDARQVARIARSAALGVYGVTDVVGARWYHRLFDVFGFGSHGVTVRSTPGLEVQVNVELAPGVPRESVLSNVADAVRYTVQRDAGHAIDALTVTVAAQ